MSATLNIVATQLFEAACCALGGDGPATQAHITRALVLLQDNLGRAPEVRQDVAGLQTPLRFDRARLPDMPADRDGAAADVVHHRFIE
jgi:hypothetical protein